jgi:hypothetical protein
MNFLENLVSDFREKKLWPVALMLLVVPIMLSSSSSPSSAPVSPVPAVAAPGPTVSGVPDVTLRSAEAHSVLSGPVRDPFVQQALPGGASRSATGVTTVQSAASAAAAAVQSGSSVTATVAHTPAPATSSPTAGAGTLPPIPRITFYTFSVDLKFGLEGHETPATNVPRLEPFPSPMNPLVLFLGVKNDRKTVVFLVSSQANPVGQGTCKPSKTRCELLSVKLGQRESFLLANDRGGVDIYNLVVTAIRLTPTKAADVAKTANSRVSVAGQKIADHVDPFSVGLHSLSYSVNTGTVSTHQVPAKWLQHLLRSTGRTPPGVVLQPVSAL